MAQNPRAIGRLAFRASLVLFGLFVLNILVGKVSILVGATTPVHAGDVAEFLVLLAAIICFIVAALDREAAR